MKLLLSLAIAAVAAASISSSRAASDGMPAPFWSSDQVRAAHPQGPENGLIFDVRAEAQGNTDPTKVVQTTVTLTPSYTYIVGGAQHSLDDFALCRTLEWSDNQPVLQSLSCYAIPAFNITELASREGLGSALKASGLGASIPPDLDPYWAEAALGAQDVPTNRLAVQRTSSDLEYRFHGDVVVRMMGSASKLGLAQSMELERYFARHWPLHPQPRHDLEASANLPNRIEIETQTPTKGVEILTISNVRRATVTFPLPAGLTSTLRAGSGMGDSLMARAVQQSLLAIDGKPSTPKPTVKSLLQGMVDAAKRNEASGIVLLFIDLTQQYGSWLGSAEGQALFPTVRPLVQAALSNPEAAMLLQINALAGDPSAPGDRQAAARALAAASTLDKLPFGTFRYVTFANLVRVSGDSSKWDPSIFKLMPSPLVDNYWMHIAAYPWASNAYKDAGDTYLANYDVVDAWLAYDLGRAVDADWVSGPMAKLGAFEKQLRSMQPDFF